MQYSHEAAMPQAGAVWTQWLRTALDLWLSRLPEWLTLGMLVFVIAEGINRAIPQSIMRLFGGSPLPFAQALPPVISYVVMILFFALASAVLVYTALLQVRGMPLEARTIAGAGHFYLPMLGLQVGTLLLTFAAAFIGAIVLLILMIVLSGRGITPSPTTAFIYGIYILRVIVDIFITTLLLVVAPTIIVERVGFFTALGHAWRNLSAYFLPGLALVFVIYLPFIAVGFLTLAFLPFITTGDTIADAVYYAICIPWLAIASVVVYDSLAYHAPA